MSDFENDSLEPQVPEYECVCGRKKPDSETFYGIGSTTPPKDYTAVVSGVLILLISICGVLTLLRLMDISLFQHQMNVPQATEGASVYFTNSGGVRPSGLEDPGYTGEEIHGTTPTGPVIPGELELQINGIPSVQPTEPDFLPATVPTEPEDPTEPTVPPETQPDPRLSWQEVYQKVIPSVVSVMATDGYTTTSGTGVIMDARGYIITNAHVVEDAVAIQVMLYDERVVAAQCLGVDEISDLAVLYIQAERLTAAEFGDSTGLLVGDEVVAIGDPLGITLRGTMTDGIISAINRNLEISGRDMSLLQTTAALNSGNSGGPLVNCYGQVIGINTMKIGDYASTAGVEGLGFAIPMATVKTIVEQLAVQGYVAGRPELGLEVDTLSSFYQHYYHLPSGPVVSWVEPGGSAWAGGIREGDILLYLNDQRLSSPADYQRLVNSLEVGGEVSLMIYRSGKEFECTIRVGEYTGQVFGGR